MAVCAYFNRTDTLAILVIGMCEHLISLDNELKGKEIKETFRGEAWSENAREWVYYDCVLNLEALRTRLHLPFCVKDHVNDDQRSGAESGFYCELCKDAVVGHHPMFSKGKIEVQ